MWDKILETLQINPEHGDWVAALLTALIFLIQSLFFMVKSFSEGKEKRILEEKDLYQDMKKVYNDLWLALTAYSPRILYCDYSDRDKMEQVVGKDVEKIRTYVYQVIDSLADVYFMYYSRESRYWKRWESIIEYVFSKRLFSSSWKSLRAAFLKRDADFVGYVDKIVTSQVSNQKELEEMGE
jgi:hypothetical protein